MPRKSSQNSGRKEGSVRISKELAQRLKVHAATAGTTSAAIAERLLDEYLRKRGA